jgi:hypothetical protein
MYIFCAILFGIALILGLYLAYRVFSGRLPDKPVILTHGALGWTGLAVLMLLIALKEEGMLINLSMTLFVTGLILGLGLLVFHIIGRRHPAWMIVLHGVTGIVAFGLLVAGILAMK